MKPSEKRIRLIATGGTIASGSTGIRNEVSPNRTASDLLADIPDATGVASVDVHDFATLPSIAITPSDMHALAGEVRHAIDEGIDGCVITHGTATMEETAYALALMVPRTIPLVLTGAMRNPTVPGHEGAGNLYAALVTAATPGAEHLGPVVVLNDELHTARWVAKTHATRPSSFASPGAGPVGEVVEGRTHIWFRPTYDDFLGFPDTLDRHTVELLRAYSGADTSWLQRVVDSKPAAVVIEGMGSSLIPPQALSAVDAAIAAGVEVVVASRVFAGRNFEATYSMPGAEIDLKARGAILVGGLSGLKARLRVLVGNALGIETAALFPVT